MNKSKVNIGVLGCANIATRSMIPTINDLKEYFSLTGIASRSREKADKFAAINSTKAFDSYEQLLNDDKLEAIYIPLPNALHAEWIEKALNRGLHVLVEKSLGCSLNEVEKLTRLAEKSQLTLMENFQFRFHPQLKVIKELLEKDEIGELRGMRTSFGFPPFQDKNNIRYKNELGGGSLLDAGAYTIKISQVFLGHEIMVKAASLHYDKEKEIDVWGGGFIKDTKSSLYSEIAFGFDNYYQCNIELWGSAGKISTDRIFTAPPGFQCKILVEKQNERNTIKVNPSNHFANMLIQFYNTIGDRNQQQHEHRQNVNQSRLIEEFRSLAL